MWISGITRCCMLLENAMLNKILHEFHERGARNDHPAPLRKNFNKYFQCSERFSLFLIYISFCMNIEKIFWKLKCLWKLWKHSFCSEFFVSVGIQIGIRIINEHFSVEITVWDKNAVMKWYHFTISLSQVRLWSWKEFWVRKTSTNRANFS